MSPLTEPDAPAVSSRNGTNHAVYNQYIIICSSAYGAGGTNCGTVTVTIHNTVSNTCGIVTAAAPLYPSAVFQNPPFTAPYRPPASSKKRHHSHRCRDALCVIAIAAANRTSCTNRCHCICHTLTELSSAFAHTNDQTVDCRHICSVLTLQQAYTLLAATIE